MGSGNCSYWAPGSFDLDDDGKVLVRDPATDEESRLVMAAEGCPVGRSRYGMVREELTKEPPNATRSI